MDSLLTTPGLIRTDPRPVFAGPSTAARDPDPKPVPGGGKPSRHHDHARAHEHHRPRGRSHVQQGLQGIVREIRHAVRDEVESSGLALETLDSIRDLERDFRRDLHDVFLEAGQRGGIDRQQVLEGMIEALQRLTAGLSEITSQNPGEDQPQPTRQDLDAAVAVGEPGTLVDLTG